MAKYILYFLLPTLLYACSSGENQTTDSDKDIYDEIEVYDDPNNMVEEAEDTATFFPFIKERISEDSYDLLVSIKDQYNSVETEEDLFILYSDYIFDGHEILNDALNDDETYDYEMGPENETWYKLMDVLPMYDMERYCSECEFEIAVNAAPLLKLAKKTPEENDDIFFEALDMFYNGKEYTETDYILIDVGNNYSFYTLSCDFCSESMLGTDAFYDVLALTQNCTDTTNIFADKLFELERRTLNYLGHDCFVSSKDEVLAELEKIAQEIKMPEEHMKKIYNEIDRVDADDEIAFEGTCEFDY